MLAIAPLALIGLFSAFAAAALVSGGKRGRRSKAIAPASSNPLNDPDSTWQRMWELPPSAPGDARPLYEYELDSRILSGSRKGALIADVSREQLLLDFWPGLSHQERAWTLQQWGFLTKNQKRIAVFLITESCSDTSIEDLSEQGMLMDIIAQRGGLQGTKGLGEPGTGYFASDRFSMWGFACGQNLLFDTPPNMDFYPPAQNISIDDIVSLYWGYDENAALTQAAVKIPRGGWAGTYIRKGEGLGPFDDEYFQMSFRTPFDESAYLWLYKNCDVWKTLQPYNNSINIILGIRAVEQMETDGDMSRMVLAKQLEKEKGCYFDLEGGLEFGNV